MMRMTTNEGNVEAQEVMEAPDGLIFSFKASKTSTLAGRLNLPALSLGEATLLPTSSGEADIP